MSFHDHDSSVIYLFDLILQHPDVLYAQRIPSWVPLIKLSFLSGHEIDILFASIPGVSSIPPITSTADVEMLVQKLADQIRNDRDGNRSEEAETSARIQTDEADPISDETTRKRLEEADRNQNSKKSGKRSGKVEQIRKDTSGKRPVDADKGKRPEIVETDNDEASTQLIDTEGQLRSLSGNFPDYERTY